MDDATTPRVTIDPETTVDALLAVFPVAAEVFVRRRMACVGCEVARFESLAEVCRIYHQDLAAITAEICQVIRTSVSRRPRNFLEVGERSMSTLEQALAIMEATPALLQTVVAMAAPEALDWRPTEEAWSIREILAHLLHVETAVIGERIRRMIREENPLLGPVPASSPPATWEAMLQAWTAARQENLAMLHALRPDQLGRTGQHPRFGTITVRDHLIEWAYHDLDHLRQMLAVLQARLYPEIGPFKAIYPPPS